MEMTAQRRGAPATTNVLALLCAMYFINYIVRVNVSTAAAVFQPELHLTNTQVGLDLLGVRVSLPRVPDRWRMGRRQIRRAARADCVRGALVVGDGADGTRQHSARGCCSGACSSVSACRRCRWPRVRCRTGRGRKKRGFAQGITHAFARLGNTLTPPVIGILLIPFVGWRGSFVVVGAASFLWAIRVVLVLPRRSRRAPGDYGRRARVAAEETRQDCGTRAVRPPGRTHDARDDRLLLLRLDAVVFPRVDPVVLSCTAITSS
jgi:hypothetical protein